ncbi:MAG: Hsp33 family molecular chaperone HslO [Alphaproteobacteria bacterium]
MQNAEVLPIGPQEYHDDLVQPFQIEVPAIRGRLVRLGPLVDDVLSRHAYPEEVAALLGQSLALTATLAGAFKYDGVFTLQTKGDGPVGMLVSDVTSAGEVRAYARYDEDRLAEAVREHQAGHGVQGVVPRLLGSGYLAFTVDQGSNTERYQGIVELEGAELVDCVHHYFRQSEQLDAAFKLAVGRVAGAGGSASWRAAGLMLQRVPAAGGQSPLTPAAAEPGFALMAEDEQREVLEEGWRRALIMMGSATTAELLDPALGAHDLLYRLFHEDGVRVFRQRALRPGCRCSEERVAMVLRALSAAELEDMVVDDRVSVVCQFCMRAYVYDRAALAALRTVSPPSA